MHHSAGFSFFVGMSRNCATRWRCPKTKPCILQTTSAISAAVMRPKGRRRTRSLKSNRTGVTASLSKLKRKQEPQDTYATDHPSQPVIGIDNGVENRPSSGDDDAETSGLVISRVWSASIADFEKGLLVEKPVEPVHRPRNTRKRFALRPRTKRHTVGIASKWSSMDSSCDFEPLCQMRKPNRTYQRRISRQESGGTARMPSSSLPETDGLEESPLGPVLNHASVSTTGKNLCLNLSFPSAPSFTFEESQCLVLLNLHKDKNDEDGDDSGHVTVPNSNCITGRTVSQKDPQPRRFPIPCGVCDKLCDNSTIWRLHRVSHEPKQCESCGLIFSSSRSLLKHLRTCGRYSTNEVPSSRFGKTYSGRQNLALQQHNAKDNNGVRTMFLSMGRTWQPGETWLGSWPSGVEVI